MRVIRRRVVASTLAVLAAAVLGPGLLPSGSATAADPTTIGELQTQLTGCTGIPLAPTTITLADDISSAATALTVPCSVRLVLAGHDLTVSGVSVASGDTFFLDDASAVGSAGTLTAQGTGASGGVRVTSAALEIDGGHVVASTVAATTAGRVEVHGGSLVAGDSTTLQGVGIDLGDRGLVASSGGSLTAVGGLGTTSPGLRVGDDGSVLVAGGSVTGTGGLGGAGVTVGARGVVVAVAGSLDATGGVNSAGVDLPATARLSVSGGVVDATGGSAGAGVGSGSGGAAGRVEISGGDVTATGGNGASGVGAGSGGTSGPLLMSGGVLTASAPAGGSALGIDKTSGTLLIQAGVLRLPSGTMTVPDAFPASPELAIGTGAILDGSDPADGPRTYATYSGAGQLDNSGVIRVPVAVVTGVQVTSDYHRVTFNARGGTPAAGGPVTLLAPSFAKAGQVFPARPSKPGVEFVGWNTAPDGSGVAITATGKLPGVAGGGAPAAVTAYAVYVFHPPVLKAALTSPIPKSPSGWYRTGVTVRYTCAQGTLPLATPCPRTVVRGKEGRGLRITRSLYDTGGNVATRTFSGIRIDRTRPSVRVTGVRDGATYDSRPPIVCHASDLLSGIRTCRIRRKQTGTVVRYVVTGIDRAGNTKVKRGLYHLS